MIIITIIIIITISLATFTKTDMLETYLNKYTK